MRWKATDDLSQILACEFKNWVLLLSNLSLIKFTAQALSWRLCPRMSCNLCSEPNEIITRVLIGNAFSTGHAGTEDDADRGSLHYVLFLLYSILCLLLWARASHVTSGKHCSTHICCVHHGRLWRRWWQVIISTYKVKKKTWNRIWKQLLSPSSINGTITTRSYCHIFSFELTWKCYILNHVCQMKGNSMKTQRYTGTFWTFYLNPKLSVCSKSAYQ